MSERTTLEPEAPLREEPAGEPAPPSLSAQILARLRAAGEGAAPAAEPAAIPVAGRRPSGRPRLGRAVPPLERADRGRPLPLSYAQERLWFLDRFEPGGTAYNLPVALGFHGRLDRAALTAAAGEIVRRHEALRTVFPAGG